MAILETKIDAMSDELYQTAFQLSGGIILVLDQDGTIISFNDRLQEITGYTHRELIQRNWFDLLIPEREKATAKRYFRRFMIRGKDTGNVISALETSKGGTCYVEWHYRRLIETENAGSVRKMMEDRQTTGDCLLAPGRALVKGSGRFGKAQYAFRFGVPVVERLMERAGAFHTPRNHQKRA